MIPLPPGPFEIIYADPPWDYAGQVQHGGTSAGYTSSAAAFYPTMKESELVALPVRDIAARNALLFLWTTGPQLEVSIRVMTAWGFAYKTIAFVWDKRAVNPGAYTMSQTELCLVGKRGSIPKPRGARNVRQLVSEMRTRHSAKPDEVAARIEAMFPTQTKLEMFARRARDGWTLWGNEAP